MALQPSFRLEGICIGTEDILIAVSHIGTDANDFTRWKEVASNLNASDRHNSRECQSDCGVQPKRLFDDCLEVRQTSCFLERCRVGQ